MLFEENLIDTIENILKIIPIEIQEKERDCIIEIRNLKLIAEYILLKSQYNTEIGLCIWNDLCKCICIHLNKYKREKWYNHDLIKIIIIRYNSIKNKEMQNKNKRKYVNLFNSRQYKKLNIFKDNKSLSKHQTYKSYL